MEGAEAFGSVRGRAIGPVPSFDGTLLHVEEAGAGPTVVLVHGFCLDLTSWHFTIRDLAEGFRLVLYDVRGHGLSERPASADWSIDALARDLDAVIEATSPREPVVVVGHSMGGMALLRYCSLFPDKVGPRARAIVLADTTERDVIGGMVPEAAALLTPALRLIEQAATRAARRSPAAFDGLRRARADLVGMLIRLMGFGPRAPRAQVAFMERMLSAVPAEVLVPIVTTLRSFDATDALEAIDVPTLVVCGARDRLTPPACSRRLAREIHHATMRAIPSCGHMPMLERPQEFNGILAAFLREPGAVYAGVQLGKVGT